MLFGIPRIWYFTRIKISWYIWWHVLTWEVFGQGVYVQE